MALAGRLDRTVRPRLPPTASRYHDLTTSPRGRDQRNRRGRQTGRTGMPETNQPGSKINYSKERSTQSRSVVRGLGRPERDVRDECLRRLVAGVIELGAIRIVVESCSQDQRDKAVIGACLVAAGVTGRVEFRLAPPSADELLWAADLITWAYLAGGVSRRAMSGLVTVHDLA